MNPFAAVFAEPLQQSPARHDAAASQRRASARAVNTGPPSVQASSPGRQLAGFTTIAIGDSGRADANAAVEGPYQICRFRKSAQPASIQAHRPESEGHGRTSRPWSSRAAEFLPQPLQWRCCVMRVHTPNRDEPYTELPMTRRLCRETPVGRPTVSGWYTRATVREKPTSGGSVSEIPTRYG
jgi:hypothetical protein